MTKRAGLLLAFAVLVLGGLGYWNLMLRVGSARPASRDSSMVVIPVQPDTAIPIRPTPDSAMPAHDSLRHTHPVPAVNPRHPLPPPDSVRHPIGHRDPAAATVDDLVRELDTASIAFATPDTLPLLHTGVVQLLLSPTDDTALVRARMRAPAAAGTAVVRAGNRMQATLTGNAFRIVSVRPEVQAVSLTASTEWLWDVTPTESGAHVLHLTLSVILPVDGHDTYFALKTFDRDLVVEIPLGSRLLGFVGSEWKWLWTTLLVPLAAWGWRRRRKGSNSPSKPA